MSTTDIIISNQTYEGIDVVQFPAPYGFAIFRFGYSSIIDDVDVTLPSGYTKLDKVVFAQNSYFMTDVHLTAADVIEVAFRYTQYVSQKGTIFSDRSINGYGFKMVSATSMQTYRGGTPKNAAASAPTSTTEMNTLVIFEDDSISLADGTVLATGFVDGGKTSGNVMSIGEASQSIIGEMGTFKVKRDGILIRKYVPCKNENDVVGFYELATNTFYQSEGTAFSEA